MALLARWCLVVLVVAHVRDAAGGSSLRRLVDLGLPWRGGSTAPELTVRVTVLTSAGSPHLDLKTRFDVSATTNVSSIKLMVEERLAGHPPVGAQRLVFGTRELQNDETVLALVKPTVDEFDMDDEDDEEEEETDGSRSPGSGPRKELSLVLDMVPPLPPDKSFPAAIEAKLKAYAAELAAVRLLANELMSGLQPAPLADTGVGGGSEAPLNVGETPMRTQLLREDIRMLEKYVSDMVAQNLTARRTKVHSAVLEDGRIENPKAVVSPWRHFLRRVAYHADVEWKGTLRNVITCFLVARFGAYGPREGAIIVNCGIFLLFWQTRPVRLGMKILFSLAAAFRGGYLVDLLSTLLPTSHQALLDAEAQG